MPDKMEITNEKGEKVQAEVIAAFKLPDYGRNYVIYSYGELDPNGLSKLYVSQLTEEADAYKFAKIETDDEWTSIKNTMREIITGTTSCEFIKVDAKPITVEGNKAIGLQDKGKTTINQKWKEEIAKVAEAPAPASPDIPVIDQAPTEPQVEATQVAGVNFQAPPQEVSAVNLDAPTVQPLDINAAQQAPAEPAVPVAEAPAAPVETPVAQEEPAVSIDIPAAPNADVAPVSAGLKELSDAELIKEVESLLARTSSIRQESIKEQIILGIKEKLALAQSMNYMTDKVLEMSDVVKKTSEVAQVANNIQQAQTQAPQPTVNVAPQTPIQPAATPSEPSVVNINITPTAEPQVQTQPVQQPAAAQPVQAAPATPEPGPALTLNQAA